MLKLIEQCDRAQLCIIVSLHNQMPLHTPGKRSSCLIFSPSPCPEALRFARSACAFFVSCGMTAPTSLLRANRPRTRGRESASVLRHWYLMRLEKLRSCRFWRYLQEQQWQHLSKW